MIKFSNVSVYNFKNAIRGMRNPLESYDKMDSTYDGNTPHLGDNDLSLAKRLRKAGSDHRKYLRQIFVSVDITAPLYWFKEYDTYKISTTSNSSSTMHTIHKKPFTEDMFSFNKVDMSVPLNKNYINETLRVLNVLRELYVGTGNKEYWYTLIQFLPSSFNQTRTCTMTYENLINMYFARKSHKLDEWRKFCGEDFILSLPYAKELIVGEE